MLPVRAFWASSRKVTSADVVLPVLDVPVQADVGGQVAGAGEGGREAGDGVGDLLAGAVAVRRAGVAPDAHDVG
jgi:hypothetical protein